MVGVGFVDEEDTLAEDGGSLERDAEDNHGEHGVVNLDHGAVVPDGFFVVKNAEDEERQDRIEAELEVLDEIKETAGDGLLFEQGEGTVDDNLKHEDIGECLEFSDGFDREGVVFSKVD